MSRGPDSIRDAIPADAPVIAEIHNQSIAAGGATMDEELKTADDVRRQLAAFGRRESLLVLEGDGAVLGWGLLKQYSPRAGYRYAGETAVFVHRDHLGEGLGSRIKRALVARAGELGYHHLVARIQSVNRASIELNKRLGYEIVGVQKEIGFQDGQWCDVTIMQLVLQPSLVSS